MQYAMPNAWARSAKIGVEVTRYNDRRAQRQRAQKVIQFAPDLLALCHRRI